MICTIEESASNEKTEAKETGAATLSEDKSETSTAPKTEVHRDELSSIEFSEQLGRIVRKSESKKPPKTPDVNELMKTIQEDLSTFGKLENQANTVTPITKARSALNL